LTLALGASLFVRPRFGGHVSSSRTTMRFRPFGRPTVRTAPAF